MIQPGWCIDASCPAGRRLRKSETIITYRIFILKAYNFVTLYKNLMIFSVDIRKEICSPPQRTHTLSKGHLFLKDKTVRLTIAFSPAGPVS